MKKHTYFKNLSTIAAATIIFIGILLYNNTAKKIFINQAFYSVNQQAEQKANEVQTFINYAANSIELYSQSIVSIIKNQEFENPTDFFSQVTKKTPFSFMEYIRADGVNVSAVLQDGKALDASDRIYYKEGIKGNSGIWINFNPAISKEALLDFYEPVIYNDKVKGVLVGAIGGRTKLEKILESYFFGEQMMSVLTDENYQIICSTDNYIRYGVEFKKHDDNDLIKNIIKNGDNNVSDSFYYVENNRKGICSVVNIPSNNWKVIMILYPKKLLKSMDAINQNLIRALFFVLLVFITYLVVTIRIHKNESKIIVKSLMDIAMKDELTGLANRHSYEQDLKKYESAEVEDNFVYAAFDVNGLKNINDNLGHEAGDELIMGAADCLKKVFSPYGKVYRTGGDEFQAMFIADNEQLEEIKKDFDSITQAWKGKKVKELRVSCGYVTKEESKGLTIHQIIKMADEKMYKAKSLYYSSIGIDRRAHRDAFEVLCQAYIKILKIDLVKDKYQIIQKDREEDIVAQNAHQKLSVWLKKFCESGSVYEDDVKEYLERTSLEYMQSYFKESKNKILSIYYRRKIGDDFKKVVMEIIPVKDFTEENQKLFLYVKEIKG